MNRYFAWGALGKVRRNVRLLADANASEVAEAALVLPLTFMMLLGIYWFGRAFNIYATINHAAREGARTAVAQSCASCGNSPPSQVFSAVTQALSASSVDPNQVQVYNPYSSNAHFCTGQSQCTTGGPNGSITWCSQVLLTPTSTYPPVCGDSISFEYPYQFWLPFTSLNQQQYLLKADVQMKGEY